MPIKHGQTSIHSNAEIYRDVFSALDPKDNAKYPHIGTNKNNRGLASGKPVYIQPLMHDDSKFKFGTGGRLIQPEYQLDSRGNRMYDKYGSPIKTGLTNDISGRLLGKHFKLLYKQIDKNLWLFINALSSYTKRYFLESWKRQGFGKVCKWPSLKKSTKEKRGYMDLFKGANGNGQVLSLTGRLQDSIHISNDGVDKLGKSGHDWAPKKMGKGPMTSHMTTTIKTDINAFKDAYPESCGIRGKGRRIREEKVTYKDYGKITMPNGQTYYGRKGRVYAGVHNSKHSGVGYNGAHTPWRKFMGFLEEFEGDPVISQMEDDYLFYSVFNKDISLYTTARKQSAMKRYEAKKGASEDMDDAEKLAESQAGYGNSDLNDDYSGSVNQAMDIMENAGAARQFGYQQSTMGDILSGD